MSFLKVVATSTFMAYTRGPESRNSRREGTSSLDREERYISRCFAEYASL